MLDKKIEKINYYNNKINEILMNSKYHDLAVQYFSSGIVVSQNDNLKMSALLLAYIHLYKYLCDIQEITSLSSKKEDLVKSLTLK